MLVTLATELQQMPIPLTLLSSLDNGCARSLGSQGCTAYGRLLQERCCLYHVCACPDKAARCVFPMSEHREVLRESSVLLAAAGVRSEPPR